MIPSSYWTVPTSHMIVLLSHLVVLLFFFSHFIVPLSYQVVPTLHITILLSHSAVLLYFYSHLTIPSSHIITYDCTFITFGGSLFFFFYSHWMVANIIMGGTNITYDDIIVTFGSSLIFQSHWMVPISHQTIPSHMMAPLIFFSCTGLYQRNIGQYHPL